MAMVAGIPSASAIVARLDAQVSTQDGDTIVEPGESAMIRVFMSWDPPSGETDPDTGARVTGFGSARADFLGRHNWDTGVVTWQINSDLIFATGDLTRKDETTQSLYESTWWQNPDGGGPYDSRDPIWMIDVFWDPAGDYSPRTVRALIDSRAHIDGSAEDTVGIYVHFAGKAFSEELTLPLSDLDFSFDVVPAPASLLVLGGGAAIARMRSRAKR